jgi:hypothetical protein
MIKKPSSKTSTATKTATATKTSTDAYTQGNVTVTGGAGRGANTKDTIHEDMERQKCAKKCIKIILEHCKQFDRIIDDHYLYAILYQIIDKFERM